MYKHNINWLCRQFFRAIIDEPVTLEVVYLKFVTLFAVVHTAVQE